MIERKYRWYHYPMMTFGSQMLVVMACIVLAGLQLVFYESIDSPVTLFSGQCAGEIKPYNDGDLGIMSAVLQVSCDTVTPFNSATLTPAYLNSQLTANITPAIMCDITETKYLSERSTKCKLTTGELPND